MIRRRLLQTFATLFVLVLVSGRASADDERDELKQRFASRYPALLRLKDQGKVGETPEGKLDVVEEAFAKEKVDPKDEKSPTIGQFLELENKDRDRLYELVAEDQKLTVKEVAAQNALRNYKKAGPEHYLRVKTEEGEWVWKQKKKIEPKSVPSDSLSSSSA